MLKKIRAILTGLRYRLTTPGEYKRGYDDGYVHGTEIYRGREIFTREQLDAAYNLGYDDGRRDGLAIAREQATKSLGEILWHQNKPNQQIPENHK